MLEDAPFAEGDPQFTHEVQALMFEARHCLDNNHPAVGNAIGNFTTAALDWIIGLGQGIRVFGADQNATLCELSAMNLYRQSISFFNNVTSSTLSGPEAAYNITSYLGLFYAPTYYCIHGYYDSAIRFIDLYNRTTTVIADPSELYDDLLQNFGMLLDDGIDLFTVCPLWETCGAIVVGDFIYHVLYPKSEWYNEERFWILTGNSTFFDF